MHLLIGILLTLSSFHLRMAQGAKTCCVTTKLRGQKFFVEDLVIEYFTLDYAANRLYFTRDPAGDVFEIIDLEKERVYNFNGNECSFQKLPNVERFSQCVTNEAESNLEFQLGSPGTQRTALAFEVSTEISEEILVYIASPPSWCSPLFTQIKESGGSKTAIYSHVRPSISDSDRKIYTNVDSCLESAVVSEPNGRGF